VSNTSEICLQHLSQHRSTLCYQTQYSRLLSCLSWTFAFGWSCSQNLDVQLFKWEAQKQELRWVWVKIEYPSYWMVNTENRQVNLWSLWSPRSLILTHTQVWWADRFANYSISIWMSGRWSRQRARWYISFNHHRHQSSTMKYHESPSLIMISHHPHQSDTTPFLTINSNQATLQPSSSSRRLLQRVSPLALKSLRACYTSKATTRSREGSKIAKAPSKA